MSEEKRKAHFFYIENEKNNEILFRKAIKPLEIENNSSAFFETYTNLLEFSINRLIEILSKGDLVYLFVDKNLDNGVTTNDFLDEVNNLRAEYGFYNLASWGVSTENDDLSFRDKVDYIVSIGDVDQVFSIVDSGIKKVSSTQTAA